MTFVADSLSHSRGETWFIDASSSAREALREFFIYYPITCVPCDISISMMIPPVVRLSPSPSDRRRGESAGIRKTRGEGEGIILRCVSHPTRRQSESERSDIWKLHFSQFITSNETINIINSSRASSSFHTPAHKTERRCDAWEKKTSASSPPCSDTIRRWWYFLSFVALHRCLSPPSEWMLCGKGRWDTREMNCFKLH